MKRSNSDMRNTLFSLIYLFIVYFYKYVVPVGFLSREIRVTFLGESQLRHNRATQSTVRAYVRCLSFPLSIELGHGLKDL